MSLVFIGRAIDLDPNTVLSDALDRFEQKFRRLEAETSINASGSTELRDRLESNTRFFRTGMEKAGFDLLPGDHPIIPIMLGDAQLAPPNGRLDLAAHAVEQEGRIVMHEAQDIAHRVTHHYLLEHPLPRIVQPDVIGPTGFR